MEYPGSSNVTIRQLEQSAVKVRPHLAGMAGCLNSQCWRLCGMASINALWHDGESPKFYSLL